MGLLDILKAVAETIGGVTEVSIPHSSKKYGEHYDITVKDSGGNIVCKEHIPSPCQPDFDGGSDFEPGKYR